MVKESKEAHQLIEEFMLANRTVAENVAKLNINKNHCHSLPCTRQPATENWRHL